MDQTMANEIAVRVLLIGLTIGCFLSCLINLAIFALNLKLYTEYFKDRKISERREG